MLFLICCLAFCPLAKKAIKFTPLSHSTHDYKKGEGGQKTTLWIPMWYFTRESIGTLWQRESSVFKKPDVEASLQRENINKYRQKHAGKTFHA